MRPISGVARGQRPVGYGKANEPPFATETAVCPSRPTRELVIGRREADTMIA